MVGFFVIKLSPRGAPSTARRAGFQSANRGSIPRHPTMNDVKITVTSYHNKERSSVVQSADALRSEVMGSNPIVNLRYRLVLIHLFRSLKLPVTMSVSGLV